jgi:hypothetical protein
MKPAQITALALANGFKLKTQPDGSESLNPYVFDFAKALIAAHDALQAGPAPAAWFVSGPKLHRMVYSRSEIEPAVSAMVDSDPNSDRDDYTATALTAAMAKAVQA